jgi:MarR family 2-MHQ and catechol resistance regulon transcriptional repressor
MKTPARARRALHAYTCLMRSAGSVTRRIHLHLADDDLTSSQFAVLEALLHLGQLCQRELGQKLLSSENNITTVIDNLERRQLVVRRSSNTDRRVKTIHLTPTGKKLIDRIFVRHAQIVADDFAVLTAQEQNELARLGRKLGLQEKREASKAPRRGNK